MCHAIWASNVRRMASGENNLRYDEWNAPPPTDPLQPISGLAVAEAMRLPYESVRRKIAELKREGICRSAPNLGLEIDAAAVNRHPASEV